MSFALGYIAGLLTATLLVLTLVYFRSSVEKKIKVIERTVEQAGPKPKGFVYEPKDEAEEAREAIIERNRRAGKDTSIADLI